jgi:hypothetical protein
MLGATALAITLAGPATAQSEDRAAARALFEDGRKLVKDGQIEAGCKKLEAASKLYAGSGILLNLADCYEKSGRTASAWSEFGEAATAANRQNRPDQASEAKRRQAAIDPKLIFLTVVVAHPVPGLVVKRDGVELPSGAWGTAMPVDPGNHEIRGEAAGREPWTTTISPSRAGLKLSVEVPELALTAPVAPSPAPTPAAAAPGSAPGGEAFAEAPAARSGSHVPEWVMIGAGAAVGIGGAILMAVEAGQASNARSTHDTAAYNASTTPYYVGVAGVVLGGVAAATGGVLLVLSGHGASGERTAVRASFAPAPGGGLLGVNGAW